MSHSSFRTTLRGLVLTVGILSLTAVNAQTVPPTDPAAQAGEPVSTHVINPLDRLLIVVYAGDKLTVEYEKVVQSDGAVYLPFLEQDVRIGGLVLPEAERALEDLSRKVVREPRVVITVLSSYAQSVFTYGRIANRAVDLVTPMRVLQLLARVGGPTEGAIEDSIRIISTDGTVNIFNHRVVSRDPNDESNIFLKPGDIVYVPGADDFTVMVFGAVNSPGAFRLKNGDHLLDAVLRAGSWSPEADIRKLRLLRTDRPGKPDVAEVNLEKVFNRADTRQNHTLGDGDIIFIPTKKPSIMQPTQAVLTMIYMLLTSVTVYQALND